MSKKPKHQIDDESTGLWAEKRARQKRYREQVANGERTPESGRLFTPEVVKNMTIRWPDGRISRPKKDEIKK